MNIIPQNILLSPHQNNASAKSRETGHELVNGDG